MDNHTKYLLLHDLHIKGSIPATLQFTEVKQLTLFNDRLSCKLPAEFLPNCSIHKENETCSSLILSQNQFKCDNDSAIGWCFIDIKDSYKSEYV